MPGRAVTLPPAVKEVVMSKNKKLVTAEDIDAAWKAVPRADLVNFSQFPLVLVDYATCRVVAGAMTEEEAHEAAAIQSPRSRYFTSDNPLFSERVACEQLESQRASA